MTTPNILVPSNFMSNDDKSIDFVIQKYAAVEDAQVTLFHAYTPIPEFNVKADPLMQRMSGNLNYLRQILRNKEERFNENRTKLIVAGFPSEKVNVIFTPLKTDIASDIIQLVRKNGYNILVMIRTPGKIARFFTGSVSKRISERMGRDVTLFVLN